MRTNCARVLMCLWLLSVVAVADSRAEEAPKGKTLAMRLSEYKHVGIDTFGQTSAYTLHLFTPEQQQQNVVTRNTGSIPRIRLARRIWRRSFRACKDYRLGMHWTTRER